MNKDEKVAYLRGASEDERQAFFRKMDAELDDFIMEKSRAAKDRRANEPKDERSIDEIIEELSTHPAFVKELDYSKPLHPLVEGLIEMKYNSEDAKDNAISYKEEGNRLYKEKDYRLAIENYTLGIKAMCEDKLLNTVLYTNRALTHHQLGNMRSAINDCIIARKFVPEHTKAIYRGCLCCLELKKYEECLKWCDVGLALDPDNSQVVTIQTKADKLWKIEERDRRKELAKERQELAAERKLMGVIQSRGVQLGWVPKIAEGSKLSALDLTSLESHHPSGARVYQGEDGVLNWPVLFMYPEHSMTDFIESFKETDRFIDHLLVMFGSDQDRPPWDLDKKYNPDTLEIYFEDKEEEKMYKISNQSTLLQVLQHNRYRVHAGTPAFILIVSGSKYRDVFLNRNKT